MQPFPLEWFHGSPLRLEELRAGSTITTLPDLARVFSHKPPVVLLDDGGGVVKFMHNGSQAGWLYRVLDVDQADVYPHPRSTMPAGLEWLTKIGLKVELIGPTELRADEFLDEAEIARLRSQLQENNFNRMDSRNFSIWLVEDNPALSKAMRKGLEATGQVRVLADFTRGEDVLAVRPADPPSAVLMDVSLAGEMNGIQVAVSLRKEFPRLPVVFYSIQDDENYYRAFLRSGILTHYAYVRKSNYLLPDSIVPLLRDAISGRSTIDPEIEARVQAVRHKDENDPLALLEPNEKAVAALLAKGLTNEQIAARLGYHDARAVSRTNGQIYTAWGLNSSTVDEKVARTRAALIHQRREIVVWDEEGVARVQDANGRWVEPA